MVLLGKVASTAFLASSLVFGSGSTCISGDSFPLELGTHVYEVRQSENSGRDEYVGGLEDDVAGHLTMDIAETGSGYSFEFSANSRAGSILSKIVDFTHVSNFKMSDSYRSLNSHLENTFKFFFLPISRVSNCLFGYENGGAIVNIESNIDGERQFDISSDTRGPLASLMKFFSGDDCRVKGRHYVGKIKGDDSKAATDVYVDVERKDDGYLMEFVLPENVIVKERVPMKIHYDVDGERVKISGMDFYVDKLLLTGWFRASPIEAKN